MSFNILNNANIKNNFLSEKRSHKIYGRITFFDNINCSFGFVDFDRSMMFDKIGIIN